MVFESDAMQNMGQVADELVPARFCMADSDTDLGV